VTAWKSLIVHSGQEIVGCIGVDPTTGQRAYWAGRRRFDPIESFAAVERIVADTLANGFLANTHGLTHPTPMPGCFWCPPGFAGGEA